MRKTLRKKPHGERRIEYEIEDSAFWLCRYSSISLQLLLLETTSSFFVLFCFSPKKEYRLWCQGFDRILALSYTSCATFGRLFNSSHSTSVKNEMSFLGHILVVILTICQDFHYYICYDQ